MLIVQGKPRTLSRHKHRRTNVTVPPLMRLRVKMRQLCTSKYKLGADSRKLRGFRKPRALGL